MKIYLRFIPMVIIMGMIFYLSHLPGDYVQLPRFTGLDKLLHGIAYGILAAAFLYGLMPFAHESNQAVTALVVVLFCLLFGISDELHQSFIPARFVSIWDIIADGVGAVSVVAWWLLQGRKSPGPGA